MSKKIESSKRGKEQTRTSGQWRATGKVQMRAKAKPQGRSPTKSSLDDGPKVSTPPTPKKGQTWKLIDPSISANASLHSTSRNSEVATPSELTINIIPELLQPIVTLKKRRVLGIAGTTLLSIISVLLTFILGRIVIEAIAPNMAADSVARVLMLMAGAVGILTVMMSASIYRDQLYKARKAATEKLSDSKYASQLENYLET